MSYQITCPYCFETMMDDEVLFRSERVNRGESDILPEDYDDLADFKARYQGGDKEAILERLREWEFFQETEDPVYQNFWAKFNGTTEENPADVKLGVQAWRRRILDPKNEQHQRYLKRQPDGSCFLRDEDGNVTQIELREGGFTAKCSRRVCRHCHNPLPDDYGKNPVKFAAVIGITGAGKTVYLSQLLGGILNYAAEVGLSAVATNASVRTFRERNAVTAKRALPGSTPEERLQQPLFFDLTHGTLGHGRTTETFVLYDVAGEVFRDAALVRRFAPFIGHADGLIVLIDPMQFEVISGLNPDGEALAEPTQALAAIHHIIAQHADRRCTTPLAVCLSKADQREVQGALSMGLPQLLLDDVHGIPGADGYNRPLFNAEEYNPIAERLNEFFKQNAPALAQLMRDNYSNYNYFAFTALGCDVAEGEQANGEPYRYPVGPVLPKRIEEPLLWLFYQLGYIGLPQGQEIFSPAVKVVYCPECGSDQTYELPEEERWATVRKLFRTKMLYQDRCCTACGCRWDSSGKGGAQ